MHLTFSVFWPSILLDVEFKHFHNMPLRDLLKRACRAFLIIVIAANKKNVCLLLKNLSKQRWGSCSGALWQLVQVTVQVESQLTIQDGISAITKQPLFSNYNSHILSRLVFLTRGYSPGISFNFLNHVWRLDSALCWARAPTAAVCKAPQMSALLENEHKSCVVTLRIFAGFKEAHLIVVLSYIPLYLETYCATKTGLSLDGNELLTN